LGFRLICVQPKLISEDHRRSEQRSATYSPTKKFATAVTAGASATIISKRICAGTHFSFVASAKC
jgi:hypothetical protein